MKKILCFATCLLALNGLPVLGQPAGQPMALTPASPLATPLLPAASPLTFEQRIAALQARSQPEGKGLTPFSLDFPGGKPSQLMQAIEKAMGKPLNAIINPEDEEVALPPVKMHDVVLPQLFAALEVASRKVVNVPMDRGGFGLSAYSQTVTTYGFRTADSPVTDTSVWYFHVERVPVSMPPVVQKVCQFYPLGEPLNRGFTVDDITTAIQTGWKLAGDTSPPELNYHKETKLLIAYGEPAKLKTIEQVLQALPPEKAVHVRQSVDQTEAAIDLLKKEVAELKGKIAGKPGPAVPAEKTDK